MDNLADHPMDKSTARRRAVIIAVLLGVFLATMTFSLRGSFWTSQDYGMLSLSHALHLEQRLRHWESNPAPGLAGHPGIPFYFASWLAVALVVPPFSAAGFDRFSEIIANAEAIYVANQAIAIVLVALGCYAFVRVATSVATLGVILAALGMWLGSTYQAILTSTSLSIETFALPLNVLFLWILLRLAASPRISAADSVIAGVVAALGYLLKLPYLYVAFGLFAAFIASTIVHRTRFVRSLKTAALMTTSFVVCVAGVGYSVIGEAGFHALLRFHKSVLLHSGLYGEGESGVVQASHVKSALHSFLSYGSMAPWVALMLGLMCVLFAITGRRSGKTQPSEVVLGIGAGVAALLAAMGVLKHFGEHYVAGVAPSLPAVVIALFLLINRVHPNFSRPFGLLLAILLTYGLSHSFYFAVRHKRHDVSHHLDILDDRRQLEDLLQAREGRALFTYHVPMHEFGEGFILHYSGIAVLQQEYQAQDRSRVSSFMHPKGLFNYVVLDKAYFPNLSAVRSATNLNLCGVAVPPSSADRMVELRRCIVVIKQQPLLLSEP